MCDFSPILLNYVADVPVVLKVTLCFKLYFFIDYIHIYLFMFK